MHYHPRATTHRPTFVWITIGLCVLCISQIGGEALGGKKATVGAYYFDGWWWYSGYNDGHVAYAASDMPSQHPEMLDWPGRRPVLETNGPFRTDSLATMEQEINLATDHGVSFFNFDWYWISNASETQDPTTLNGAMYRFMDASNNSRMKFAVNLCIKPTTTADWQSTADILIPILKNPQYQRVGGKPLVTTGPGEGEFTQEAHDILQQAAINAGLPGLAFSHGEGSAPTSLADYTTRYNAGTGWEQGVESHPYSELINTTVALWDHDRRNLGFTQKYMPTVMSGWDSRAWSGNHWYYPDRTPEAFATHVQDAIDWMDANPDKTTSEKIMMLYAWNEYGEGGYIAPTWDDPNGLYLDALKSVIGVPEPGSLILLGTALIGLLGHVWRKQRWK